MQKSLLAAVCAAVLSVAGVSEAAVDGQVFDIDVSSSVSGNFSGELAFFTLGVWTLDVDGSSEGGSGDYTQAGAALTLVTATGDNSDDYVGTYIALALDLKQAPGIIGAIARRNNTPASITGRGFGNAGDVFTFSGTEILP